MAIAALSVSDSALDAVGADVLVVASQKSPDGPLLLAPEGLDWLAELLPALGVGGGADELVRVPNRGDGPPIVAIAGLGRQADAAALRLAAGSAARQLAGTRRATFAFPVADAAEAAAVLEGAALGAYAFTAFRSTGGKTPLAEIELIAPFSEQQVDVDRIRTVVESVALVKDLVNTPPAELGPGEFAEQALVAASGLPIETTVLNETELAAGGYGGILGVGSGSPRGPRLVKLDYAPEAAGFHLALVGKGITFDSGGLSLKTQGGMLGMKTDMAGAAVVLAAVVAVARLGLPVRVTGWLCLAENMPSGTAVRPNDVLRMRNGKTVEVTNTDAEGRLVLADGLSAASEEHPDAVIDVATLTGAQVVALGNRTSGVLGDRELGARLLDAAEEVGEAFWPMPIPGEMRARLDSDVADLQNATVGDTAGGMLLAAAFLREFVGDSADGEALPWAHLDIAGPANNTKGAWGFTGKGGTAVALRTLVRLSEEISGK